MLHAEVLALVGHEVVITLHVRPTVQVVGTLLDASDDGEARYRTALGEVHSCWPLLDVERRYSAPTSTHD